MTTSEDDRPRLVRDADAPLKSKAVRLLRERWRTSRLGRGGAVVGWPNEEADAMESRFVAAGIPIERWSIAPAELAEFHRRARYPAGFLGGPETPDFHQRALEHFAALALTKPQAGETVIDVGSNASPLLDIVRDLSGAEAYEQDLQFPPGVHGSRIGGDAAAMPVPDGFADALLLCSAFPHFEGDADSRFVAEAYRVLRPGGHVAILPLYLSDVYGAKTDPRLRWSGLRFDEGMTPFLIPGLNVRFSRSYDPVRLRERVLEPASRAGFDHRLLRVTNGRSLVPESYLDFALVLERPASG